MEAILQTTFKYILFNDDICVSIQFSLSFVPIGPIGNKTPLALAMAWHQTCNEPFHDKKLTCTPTYMLVPSNKRHPLHANELKISNMDMLILVHIITALSELWQIPGTLLPTQFNWDVDLDK